MEYLTKVIYADGSEGQCLVSNLRTFTGPHGTSITADVLLIHQFLGVKKLVSGPTKFPVPFGAEYVIRVIEQVVSIAMQCEAVFVSRTPSRDGKPEVWVFGQDEDREVCSCAECEEAREMFWEQGIEVEAHESRCDECIADRADRLYSGRERHPHLPHR